MFSTILASLALFWLFLFGFVDSEHIFLAKHLVRSSFTPIFLSKICCYKTLYQNLWIVGTFILRLFIFLELTKNNNISYLPSFSLPWTGKQKEANFVATEMLQYFEGHRHWHCKLIAFWAIYNFSKWGE